MPQHQAPTGLGCQLGSHVSRLEQQQNARRFAGPRRRNRDWKMRRLERNPTRPGHRQRRQPGLQKASFGLTAPWELGRLADVRGRPAPCDRLRAAKPRRSRARADPRASASRRPSPTVADRATPVLTWHHRSHHGAMSSAATLSGARAAALAATRAPSSAARIPGTSIGSPVPVDVRPRGSGSACHTP